MRVTYDQGQVVHVETTNVTGLGSFSGNDYRNRNGWPGVLGEPVNNIPRTGYTEAGTSYGPPLSTVRQTIVIEFPEPPASGND